MGEVIKFDFKAGKVPGVKKEENTEQRPRITAANFDITRMIEEGVEPYMKFLEFARTDKFNKILSLQTTPESLIVAKETIQKYTTDQLVDRLEHSEEWEWVEKPSLFNTMIIEMHTRLNKFKIE